MKSSKGQVLFQNLPCIEKCGLKKGEFCQGRCLEKFREAGKNGESAAEGFFHFPRLDLEHGMADAMIINDGCHLLTILHPLENKIAEKMHYYQEIKLTKRELEVASLLLEGLANSEISTRLFISRASLKTHINNIYKKVPVTMRPRS